MARPPVWLFMLALFALGWGFRAPLARSLEDATGETEPAQQVKALFLRLNQRPLATADLMPVAYTSANPYGANTFLEQEVEEWKLRLTLEMLRGAGVKWIRQQMPWDRIEIPTKGQYSNQYGSTWDSYDRFIDLALEYDMNILARPGPPPPLGRPPPT